MRTLGVLLCIVLFSLILLGQQPRVFVTDSQSWEMSGGAGGAHGTFGSSGGGGARPQTAEIIKTFGEKCSNVLINNKKEKADYIVVLDHEGGKGWIRKDNKVVVFNSEGDSIVSRSTRSLGSSVETACAAITKDWAAKAGKSAEAKEPATAPPAESAGPAAAPAPEMTGGKISITSSPVAADIEIDGAFVGSTPSVVTLEPGTHTVSIRKNGFKVWERKIKVTGGDVNVTAELEKTE